MKKQGKVLSYYVDFTSHIVKVKHNRARPDIIISADFTSHIVKVKLTAWTIYTKPLDFFTSHIVKVKLPLYQCLMIIMYTLHPT